MEATAHSLPYVQRAAASTIRLSKSLSRSLTIFEDDLATTEILRNLALSVATVDRCLSQLTVQVLVAAGVAGVHQEEPLDSLLSRLQSLAPEKLAKLLPPGDFHCL
jgi:hypothetical protein